jgi:hypothetical protein
MIAKSLKPQTESAAQKAPKLSRAFLMKMHNVSRLVARSEKLLTSMDKVQGLKERSIKTGEMQLVTKYQNKYEALDLKNSLLVTRIYNLVAPAYDEQMLAQFVEGQVKDKGFWENTKHDVRKLFVFARTLLASVLVGTAGYIGLSEIVGEAALGNKAVSLSLLAIWFAGTLYAVSRSQAPYEMLEIGRKKAETLVGQAREIWNAWGPKNRSSLE